MLKIRPKPVGLYSTGHLQQNADFTKGTRMNSSEFVPTFLNIYEFANVNS